jgi:hypothetical protein
VFSVYVAPCFVVVPLSRLMCEVIVSYVVCLPSGMDSWFMYCSHDVCILWLLCVVGLGSYLCSWVVKRIRVVLSVDRASSRLLLTRWRSPLFILACIAFVFSMCTLVCPERFSYT